MKIATTIFVASVICFLGCRPTTFTGTTITAEKPGETKVIRLGPEYTHVKLIENREDNRGNGHDPVRGEIKRK